MAWCSFANYWRYRTRLHADYFQQIFRIGLQSWAMLPHSKWRRLFIWYVRFDLFAICIAFIYVYVLDDIKNQRTLIKSKLSLKARFAYQKPNQVNRRISKNLKFVGIVCSERYTLVLTGPLCNDLSYCRRWCMLNAGTLSDKISGNRMRTCWPLSVSNLVNTH